jgi:hypothetical protein
MGYRHYLYKVDKGLLNKIHHMEKDTFFKWGVDNGLVDDDDEEPYLPLYKIGEELFGFGKYYENANEIQMNGRPLFADKELSERYEEYEPFIVGKEAVLNAIEHQKSLIVQMYENMLLRTDEERLEEDFDERTKEQIYEQHLKSMYIEWKNGFNKVFAINLDSSNPVITTSWKYEYSIFELVRLYKVTDWDKYGLIFMGW